MATKTNTEFELMGINHLAPTCRDMKETVDFYSGVLGMPLICTTAAGPIDQVFFFDAGNGTCLAFMWSPDYPPAAPGVASPARYLEDNYKANPPAKEMTEAQLRATKGTAVGALNHIALNVAPEKIEEYREKLLAKGIDVSPGREPRAGPVRPLLSVPAARRARRPAAVHAVDLLPRPERHPAGDGVLVSRDDRGGSRAGTGRCRSTPGPSRARSGSRSRPSVQAEAHTNAGTTSASLRRCRSRTTGRGSRRRRRGRSARRRGRDERRGARVAPSRGG